MKKWIERCNSHEKSKALNLEQDLAILDKEHCTRLESILVWVSNVSTIVLATLLWSEALWVKSDTTGKLNMLKHETAIV